MSTMSLVEAIRRYTREKMTEEDAFWIFFDVRERYPVARIARYTAEEIKGKLRQIETHCNGGYIKTACAKVMEEFHLPFNAETFNIVKRNNHSMVFYWVSK